MRNIHLPLFLTILRAGIWQTDVDMTAWDNCFVEWKEMISFAKKQGVVGYFCEGLMRIAEDKKTKLGITSEIEDLAAQIVANVVQQYYRHCEVTCHLFSVLEEQGFHPILLKGISLAINYPRPELRQNGDIDIYICPKEYESCKVFFHSIENEKFLVPTDGVHHYHTSYQGIEVDLHHSLGRLPNPTQNRRFQRWTLKHYQGQYIPDFVSIHGHKLRVPEKEANYIDLYRHLWGHFLTRGIGYRQLVDFMMFAYRHQDRIHEEPVLSELSQFGLKSSFGKVVSILVNQFGMPATLMIPDVNAKDTSKLFQRITQEGNMGRDSFLSRPYQVPEYLQFINFRVKYLRRLQNDLSMLPFDRLNSIALFSLDVIDCLMNFLSYMCRQVFKTK